MHWVLNAFVIHRSFSDLKSNWIFVDKIYSYYDFKCDYLILIMLLTGSVQSRLRIFVVFKFDTYEIHINI